MYQPGDRVLKKNVSYGIYSGAVLQSWLNSEGIEYVRVYWDNSRTRSICKASAVLPETPENEAILEERYNRHEERIHARREPKNK